MLCVVIKLRIAQSISLLTNKAAAIAYTHQRDVGAG